MNALTRPIVHITIGGVHATNEPTIIKTTSFRSDRRLREGFAVRCLTSHRKSRCDGAKIGNKRNQSESWREVALRGNALMTDNACYRTP